jgi:mRNA interferase YafQ
MKELRYTKQFKKDIKRVINQPEKLNALLTVLDLLKQEKELPAIYKLHKLTGDYKGCWECHFESDFLLIWYDESTNTLALYRLGSHSELFKN